MALTAPPGSGAGRSALVVDDDEMIVALVTAALEGQGMTVTTASDGHEALARLAEAIPDVIVSDVTMPGMDGFALVSRLRAEPATRAVPLLFLTSLTGESDVLTGLRLGADDYVVKPFRVPELVARVLAKLNRPPTPVENLVRDPSTGLLSLAAVTEEVEREARRARATGRDGAVALLEIAELSQLRDRFGARAEAELAGQLTRELLERSGPLDRLGRDRRGRFVLALPETAPDEARARLTAIAEGIASSRHVVAGEGIQVTPVVGWASFFDVPADRPAPGPALLRMSEAAADAAGLHLDLQPVRWSPALEAPQGGKHRARSSWMRRREQLRTPVQILLTLLMGVVVPFLVYVALWVVFGVDFGNVAYIAVVIALLVTGLSIWAEGFLALRPLQPPPPRPGADPHPPASALIAAYLPNEALTIVETIEAFLAQDYPGRLQIVLAYNGPTRLPVEDEFERIAARDPRFVPLRVEGSTSKAQNVNAGLAVVTGEFVGVFDADHHPDPSSFRRAWQWIAGGYDVVQGHCLVRNGDASWIARTTAVEFEAIYAVSHPGRARLHGFGVFGGSNGYWRTDLLRRIRMHGFMLTEDIDSSLRVVEEGGRIANDPALISRELAPTTLKALWNQRMRWAQGWFQVSMKHLPRALRAKRLSLRQKLGMAFLLGWREAYPWISLQMIPVIGYFAWRAGGLDRLDWLVPLFVLTTLFTASVGPGQVIFARLLAAPEIRRQRGWFLRYFVITTLFYTELKNLIARVAQLKEATGEREWKVTPRSAVPGAGGPSAHSSEA